MCMCYSKGTFSLCVFGLFFRQEEEGEAREKDGHWQQQWQFYVARKSTGHGRWR